MLMALALLAAIEAVPSSTVSLTLSDETDRPPVSATPRSLSDVARELREGRKAIGGFSAVESTVTHGRVVYVPMYEPEPEQEMREPEPEEVVQAQPVYEVPAYLPAWFGGPHQRTGRPHRHPAPHVGASRTVSPRLPLRSAPPTPHLRHTPVGILRQR